MPPIVRTSNNQYSMTAPAHKFQQGGRDVYYFALTLDTIDGTLPQRVEDDVVRDANRRLMPSHARNIQQYLNEKKGWLLGSLMLGIAQDAVEFEPYPNEEGEADTPNFGELRVRTKRMNTMRIFDGQHRRRAIQEALAALTYDERHADKLEYLRKSSLTIILYAEDDIKTLRQMFVDASKTKRIEASTVTRFDRRDAFNITAVRLAENSLIFKERVEMERSSVRASSQNLVAINQLASLLKSLEVGYDRRVSRELNETYMLNQDDLYERCRVWADEFLPAAREEYSGLLDGSIDNSEIPQLRANSFAYNVIFVRVLAGCYQIWKSEGRDWLPLANFIRKALIDRRSGHGLLTDVGLTSPDGASLFARSQDVRAGISHIVNAAKRGGGG